MGLSVYIHIPYCLQRCRYCDFTTFEFDQILPPDRYLDLLQLEIRKLHQFLPTDQIETIYFGGGTPSLVPAEIIVSILNDLANVGLKRIADAEVTIEINPATVDEQKLDLYQKAGINRFSVGAQTFNDDLLKLCGRRHSADDTRKTLNLLSSRNLNYSFDLLFALPGQTQASLKSDLEEVARFKPPHISPYCLTVPEGHPMATGRPPEDDQVEMFNLIETSLSQMNYEKYEISNFSQPGYESKHNQAYWSDRPYWGIGLSAHSYFPHLGDWGTRFWNSKVIPDYEHWLLQEDTNQSGLWHSLPAKSFERLKKHESLTDFLHMHLRTATGLHLSAVRKKFGPEATSLVEQRLQNSTVDGLLKCQDGTISLTPEGQLLSNLIFSHFLVTHEDLPS